jgi:hypothetical protein
MQEKPAEPDLAKILEERWYVHGPDGEGSDSDSDGAENDTSQNDGFPKCQRVSVEHSIYAKDYAHYKETPEGMAIIDKYFDNTYAWKRTPPALD